MDTTPRRIAVVAAGLSQPSATRLLADRLAAAAVAALGARGIPVEVTVLEAREHARDLTDHLLTGFPGPRLAAAIASITGADGLIAVTPIFSGSYSGLFKTFVDVLERDALDGIPTVVAATGGTARHSLALDHALRPLFAYLHAATLPTGVFAATDDWGDPQEAASLAARISRAGAELAQAMAARPPRTAPSDALDDILDFRQLLAGSED
jgi:FMN reductase